MNYRQLKITKCSFVVAATKTKPLKSNFESCKIIEKLGSSTAGWWTFLSNKKTLAKCRLAPNAVVKFFTSFRHNRVMIYRWFFHQICYSDRERKLSKTKIFFLHFSSQLSCKRWDNFTRDNLWRCNEQQTVMKTTQKTYAFIINFFLKQWVSVLRVNHVQPLRKRWMRDREKLFSSRTLMWI